MSRKWNDTTWSSYSSSRSSSRGLSSSSLSISCSLCTCSSNTSSYLCTRYIKTIQFAGIVSEALLQQQSCPAISDHQVPDMETSSNLNISLPIDR